MCQTIATILVTFIETLVTLLPLQFLFTLPIGKTVRGLALETYTEASTTHGKEGRVSWLRIETEGMT